MSKTLTYFGYELKKMNEYMSNVFHTTIWVVYTICCFNIS